MSEARESAERLVEKTKGYTVSPAFVMPPTDPFWLEAREEVMEAVKGLRDALSAALERERENEGWARSADAYMEALRKLEAEHGELQRDYQSQIEHTNYVRAEYERRLGKMRGAAGHVADSLRGNSQYLARTDAEIVAYVAGLMGILDEALSTTGEAGEGEKP